MIELLRKRRSIRKYLKKNIESEKLSFLQEAILRSPTSRNIKSWNFIFVQDNLLIEKLSQSKKHGATFLLNAPLAVVVLGEEELTDVWVEDCSIAITILQLTAESLNLASCWIQIRNRKYDDNTTSETYIKKLLKIPENLKVEAIVAIGYPDETKQLIPEDHLEYSRIHNDIW